MFAVGDSVQPRAGGPKLKVVEVQGGATGGGSGRTGAGRALFAEVGRGHAVSGRGRLRRLLKPLA